MIDRHVKIIDIGENNVTDIKSREERSKNMAAIKSKDTKPEQYICHELFKRGYRYRKNAKYIKGHPDLFLRKYNTAIFVHGCFWHRHKDCKYAYMPKSNIEFWQEKFERNIIRDMKVQESLKQEGVKCLIVWECTIKQASRSIQSYEATFKRIEDFIHNKEMWAEI